MYVCHPPCCPIPSRHLSKRRYLRSKPPKTTWITRLSCRGPPRPPRPRRRQRRATTSLRLLNRAPTRSEGKRQKATARSGPEGCIDSGHPNPLPNAQSPTHWVDFDSGKHRPEIAPILDSFDAGHGVLLAAVPSGPVDAPVPVQAVPRRRLEDLQRPGSGGRVRMHALNPTGGAAGTTGGRQECHAFMRDAYCTVMHSHVFPSLLHVPPLGSVLPCTKSISCPPPPPLS